MQTETQRVVQGQLEAYNRRDLEAFVRFYSDDIQISDLTSVTPRIQGRAQLRVVYDKLFRENPVLNCKVVSRMAAGSFVVDEERVSGLVARPEGLHIAVIYLVEAGLIQKVWMAR